MKLGQKKEKQVPNGQTYHRLPMFHQLIIIRGDFHQPRGGGTSDEQGELDTRIQDGHFTSLCGTHRSHRNLTFHVCIHTTTTQTQKKKTSMNASSIHFVNASYIHSYINASSIHFVNASYIHPFINASYIHPFINASSIHFVNASYIHPFINASSILLVKRIVYSFTHTRIVPSFHKRIVHSLKKKPRRPFIGPALMSLTHKQNTQIIDLTTKSFTYTKPKQPKSQHDADPRGQNTNTAKTNVQQQQ